MADQSSRVSEQKKQDTSARQVGRVGQVGQVGQVSQARALTSSAQRPPGVPTVFLGALGVLGRGASWRCRLSKFSCAALLFLSVPCSVTPALAQAGAAPPSKCGTVPSSAQLVTGTFGNFRQLASRESAGILGIGAAAAIGARSVDADVTRDFPNQATFGDTFKPGEVLGGTPFELGGSFAAYALGRALDKPCVAVIGAELFQAQLMGEMMTFALKQATRRTRPEGTGFSFPSGHTTVAFASATVLQRHFGWKVGVPAYAVATYVAASRVEQKHHYLSDVAFGAALGIAAGRTVPMGHGHGLMVAPIVTPDGTGAGAGFTWVPRR